MPPPLRIRPSLVNGLDTWIERRKETIDLSPCMRTGDTVASVHSAYCVATADNPGSAVPTVDTPTASGITIGVFLSGGVDGANYLLKLEFTTAAGDTLTESIEIHVRSHP